MPEKNSNWEERYRRWRDTNHGAEVFEELEEAALKMYRMGFKQYSMQMIVYIVRYHRHLKTGKDEAGWKINNNFTSYLAREIAGRGFVPNDFFEQRN